MRTENAIRNRISAMLLSEQSSMRVTDAGRILHSRSSSVVLPSLLNLVEPADALAYLVKRQTLPPRLISYEEHHEASLARIRPAGTARSGAKRRAGGNPAQPAVH